jgi:hypothetical protein
LPMAAGFDSRAEVPALLRQPSSHRQRCGSPRASWDSYTRTVAEVLSDLYISADIEADGPIPGDFSMLAFGLCCAATFDGSRFEVFDPEAATFYAELRPISDKYEDSALEVSGLDRDSLMTSGRPAEDAMTEAARWVHLQADGRRPIMVGFPAPYDWLFLYWYFVRFSASGSPFDFSACLDMKTMYQAKARVVMDDAGLTDLPPFLGSSRSHTHNALDDAIEQAEIFAKLFEWTPEKES